MVRVLIDIIYISVFVITGSLFSVSYVNAATNAQVLIIQDVDPWSGMSNQNVLNLLGISYDIKSIDDISSAFVLTPYKMVIVAGDQTNDFYLKYESKSSYFKTFLGGANKVLIIGAADQGWNSGELTQITGGVSQYTVYSDTNTVSIRKHPVVERIASTFTDSSASHGYFANLKTGTKVITKDESGQPTTIEYKLNSGRVVASTSPLEWMYGYGNNKMLLFNVLLYGTSKALISQNISSNGWSLPVPLNNMKTSMVFLDPEYKNSFPGLDHLGVDIKASSTSIPVKSICSGHVVKDASVISSKITTDVWNSRIVIACDDHGFEIIYGHVSRQKVSLVNGTHVDKGQTIAYIGDLGSNTHLHLGLNSRGRNSVSDPECSNLAKGWGRVNNSVTYEKIKYCGWENPLEYLRAYTDYVY